MERKSRNVAIAAICLGLASIFAAPARAPADAAQKPKPDIILVYTRMVVSLPIRFALLMAASDTAREHSGSPREATECESRAHSWSSKRSSSTKRAADSIYAWFAGRRDFSALDARAG